MRTRSAVRNGAEYRRGAGGPEDAASGLRCRWRIGWRALYTRLLDRALPRLRRVALRNLAMALAGIGRTAATGNCRRCVPLDCPGAGDVREISGDRPEQREAMDPLRGPGDMSSRRCGRATAYSSPPRILGNWELSAYAYALLSAPMNVVVRPLDNPSDRCAGGAPPRACPAIASSASRSTRAPF